jgi:diguanylate cyclase (GGDEF)-like protein/PAS domain S-box-containing protein
MIPRRGPPDAAFPRARGATPSHCRTKPPSFPRRPGPRPSRSGPGVRFGGRLDRGAASPRRSRPAPADPLLAVKSSSRSADRSTVAGKLERLLVDLQQARVREPLLARAVGALFVFGGVLGLVSLLLPHPPESNDEALFIIDAIAFALGGTYVAAARQIPRWLIHFTIAGSSALICSAIYFSGVAAGLYASMFVWVVLFSGYFFSTPAALLQLGWLLACYAMVLTQVENSAGYSPLTRWLLSAIALSVASGLTSWLVSRRQAAEERSEHFFELSRDMLCTANVDGYFLDVNPAWSETLGYSRAELLSRPFIEFVCPDDRERTMEESGRIFDGGETVKFENRYLAKEGSSHWLQWSAKLGPQKSVVYARATDVSERKRLEAEREELIRELDSQARTDALTGLPNRRWLDDELDRELARAGRLGFELCLALIDLDHFKRFNDRFGHQAGDALLREACQRWRSVLRVSDFLARYGGEEFIVLLPDCGPADARVVVERMRRATPAGQTCSAGIARWNPKEPQVALIARADAALYEAKAAGRDQVRMAEQEVRATTVARTL